MIRRHDHWPEALHAFIDSRRAAPFAWGKHDCCMFAADAVIAITGVDIAADFRGRYNSARSATRIIRREGGAGGLQAIVTRLLGEPTNTAYASRGSLMLTIDKDINFALGVCVGGKYAMPADVGLIFKDNATAFLAWDV